MNTMRLSVLMTGLKVALYTICIYISEFSLYMPLVSPVNLVYCPRTAFLVSNGLPQLEKKTCTENVLKVPEFYIGLDTVLILYIR